MENGTPSFPAVRACIFDMDGLLIDSEDVMTRSVNRLLTKYGRRPLPPSLRAQLMGVPESTNGDAFHGWARLPISREAWARESKERMRLDFAACRPLPGAERLLSRLGRAVSASSGRPIELALASSSTTASYERKASLPATERLLAVFPAHRRVLGDDGRLRPGRGKPAPDIYLVALQALNSMADAGGRPIRPDECLVFEDSVAGVEAARRAAMRVVWVPHPDVAVEYASREPEVLAGGRTAIDDAGWPGEIGDGWAERIQSLERFAYDRYGVCVPPE